MPARPAPAPQPARAPSRPALPARPAPPPQPARAPSRPAVPAPAAPRPILTSEPQRGRPWLLWAAVGAAVIAGAVVGAVILLKRPKKTEAPVVEKPSGPDPVLEAKIADLYKQAGDLETKGRYEEALAILQQIAALRADDARLAPLKARLEEKKRQLAAYLKEMKKAEAAREEAAAKDTPANWQKVADACAEAEKLALLEEHRAAARDLAAEASQRRDWAAAREEEQKGNLDAAIELAAKAAAAREAPPDLAAYRASLEKKRRKREFDKVAAAARAEADPRRAIELWQQARTLADLPKDVEEADRNVNALKPRVDPAEREKRYEASMKAAEEALAADRLDEAEKAYREARTLKGIDLKADLGLAKVEAARRKKAYEAAMAEAAQAEGKKEWRRAMEAYDRALRIQPGDKAASERRQQIQAAHRPPRLTLVLDPTVDVRMEFVLINPGTFLMGDPQGDSDEKPREVTLTRDYWMQVTEVTQAQWRAVMGPKTWSFSGLPTLPAEGVSWEEAQKFIEKLNALAEAQLGGRKAALPTEAEWEYACRAGTRTRYVFGDGDAELEEHAWFTRNSQKSTQGAGRKRPNAWGLCDMYGNVAEWCQDWYGAYGKDKAEDPSGPAEGQFRVFRGGSWNDRAVNCRSSKRDKGPPDKESMFVGLRAVLR